MDKKRVNYLLDELMLIIKKLGQLIDQKEERIKELKKQRDDLLIALADTLEWLQTGKVEGVGFDEQSVIDSIREAIKKAASALKRTQLKNRIKI